MRVTVRNTHMSIVYFFSPPTRPIVLHECLPVSRQLHFGADPDRLDGLHARGDRGEAAHRVDSTGTRRNPRHGMAFR